MKAEDIISYLIHRTSSGQKQKSQKQTKNVHFQNEFASLKHFQPKKIQFHKNFNIENITCFSKNKNSFLIGTNDGKLFINHEKVYEDANVKILDCIFSKSSQPKIFFSFYHLNTHELVIYCLNEGPLFTVDHVHDQWTGGGLEIDALNRIWFGVGLPWYDVEENEIHPSQDNRCLYGKILRIYIHTEDVPPENPFQKNGLGAMFRNEIVHNGLRNPHKLHLDEKGFLWVTDSGNDDPNMNENIYKLDQPSNCRWNFYDGFQLLKPPSNDFIYILNQSSPHASYQSPRNEYPLDCLPKIGSSMIGGAMMYPSETFIFADREKGLLSLEPEINMNKVISQSNDISILDEKNYDFISFFRNDQNENEVFAMTTNGKIYLIN